MVFDNETFRVLHKLTEEGEEAYKDMLEKEADRILYKKEHPILYIIDKIIDFLYEYE